MSDLTKLNYYIRIEFVRDCIKKTIIINQSKYIKKVLKQSNIKEYKYHGYIHINK